MRREDRVIKETIFCDKCGITVEYEDEEYRSYVLRSKHSELSTGLCPTFILKDITIELCTNCQDLLLVYLGVKYSYLDANGQKKNTYTGNR